MQKSQPIGLLGLREATIAPTVANAWKATNALAQAMTNLVVTASVYRGSVTAESEMCAIESASVADHIVHAVHEAVRRLIARPPGAKGTHARAASSRRQPCAAQRRAHRGRPARAAARRRPPASAARRTDAG